MKMAHKSWVCSLMIAVSIGLPSFAFSQDPDSLQSKKNIIKSQQSPPPVEEGLTIEVQGDSLSKEAQDSLKAARKREFRMSRDPKVAVRRSLILPGWGQAYNHRYWKIPIIYAGFAATTFVILDQNTQFQQYKQAVKCRAYGTCVDEFPDEDLGTLISNREFYRRNRDLSVIITGLWYTLQVVDAYIDSHMMGFDVSDDLSFRLSPIMLPSPGSGHTFGSGLTFQWTLP